MNTLTIKRGQSGMTYMGMLILLIVIAFFAVVTIMVVQLYMANFKVKSVLNSLKDEREIASIPPAEIEKRVMSRLYINDVDIKRENLKIVRTPNKTVNTHKNKTHKQHNANLDIVASFQDNRVEVGTP